VRFPFNEAKATEAAAYLLKRDSSPMGYPKLINLLYLADREALLLFGRPITTDCYVLTSLGPSLSQLTDLITVSPFAPSIWEHYISPFEGRNKQVSLLREASTLGELSGAEKELIDAILSRYGRKSEAQLIEELRALPEWHDPQGTKIPLEYIDILKAGGKTPSEADAIVSELESLAAVIAFVEPYGSGADA